MKAESLSFQPHFVQQNSHANVASVTMATLLGSDVRGSFVPSLRHRDLLTSFLTGLQKNERSGETKVNAYNRLEAAHSLDLYGSVKGSAPEVRGEK